MNETMGMSYASLYYAEVGKNNELQEENTKLKELCDKYEEEHSTTFIEWQKDIKANKKAIEYINKNAFDVVNSEHKSIINVEELLNILKGSDKDDN